MKKYNTVRTVQNPVDNSKNRDKFDISNTHSLVRTNALQLKVTGLNIPRRTKSPPLMKRPGYTSV